jgi:OOP family OmpA-OmpF porin
MSFGKTSWLAVVPLLIVWLVTNLLMTERVEMELATRAVAAVGTVIGKPSVSVVGRDAIVGGLAFSTQGSEAALKAVRDTPGIRLAESAITLVPVAKPYGFEGKRDGDRLVLFGNVPDPAIRARLLRAAKASAPGAIIVDDMSYARGAPDGFEAIVTYGLTEAGKLADSWISLSDNAYSIAGRASTTAIYRAALAATRQLPAGATVAKVVITSDEISPYIFNASKRDGAVRLSGHYPDEQAHQDLIAAAQWRFFNSKVSDGFHRGCVRHAAAIVSPRIRRRHRVRYGDQREGRRAPCQGGGRYSGGAVSRRSRRLHGAGGDRCGGGRAAACRRGLSASVRRHPGPGQDPVRDRTGVDTA